MIYRKIEGVELDVFSPVNLVLHFDICESPGSKFPMNNDHLLDAKVATNVFLSVKYQGQSSLEQHFFKLGLDL